MYDFSPSSLFSSFDVIYLGIIPIVIGVGMCIKYGINSYRDMMEFSDSVSVQETVNMIDGRPPHVRELEEDDEHSRFSRICKIYYNMSKNYKYHKRGCFKFFGLIKKWISYKYYKNTYSPILVTKNYYQVPYYYNSTWYKFPIIIKKGPNSRDTITMAHLIAGTDPSRVESIDITDEILEWAGPNHDFYGFTPTSKQLGYKNKIRLVRESGDYFLD